MKVDTVQKSIEQQKTGEKTLEHVESVEKSIAEQNQQQKVMNRIDAVARVVAEQQTEQKVLEKVQTVQKVAADLVAHQKELEATRLKERAESDEKEKQLAIEKAKNKMSLEIVSGGVPITFELAQHNEQSKKDKDQVEIEKLQKLQEDKSNKLLKGKSALLQISADPINKEQKDEKDEKNEAYKRFVKTTNQRHDDDKGFQNKLNEVEGASQHWNGTAKSGPTELTIAQDFHQVKAIPGSDSLVQHHEEHAAPKVEEEKPLAQ